MIKQISTGISYSKPLWMLRQKIIFRNFCDELNTYTGNSMSMQQRIGLHPKNLKVLNHIRFVGGKKTPHPSFVCLSSRSAKYAVKIGATFG